MHPRTWLLLTVVLGFLGAVLGIHMVFSAFAPKEG